MFLSERHTKGENTIFCSWFRNASVHILGEEGSLLSYFDRATKKAILEQEEQV